MQSKDECLRLCTSYTKEKSFRKMTWDEENRLMGINDNGRIHQYTYDAAGERVIKSSGDSQNVAINGQTAATIVHTDDYTGYVSPYFVISKGKFTKHYFEGAGRIVSKLGNGAFAQPLKLTAGGVNYSKLTAEQQKAMDAYVRSLGVPPGPPTQQGIYATPEFTGDPYLTDVLKPTEENQEPPEGWPRNPIFNAPGDVPGPPVQFGPPVEPATVQAGEGFTGIGLPENDIFYFHPDHLGSTSYITTRNGSISQHVEYIAFGEVLFEEHSSSFSSPYLFNGKELDRETNLSYYGARYLDMRTSLWLSVDPLAEQTMTSYTFCRNNPIMFVDPNGMKEYESMEAYTKATNKDKLGKGDWLKSDREKHTSVWDSANEYNIKNNNKGQYEPYEQVAAFYNWVDDKSKNLGQEVKWMEGAYGLVKTLDSNRKYGGEAFIGDDVIKVLEDLNVAIADATLPYFKDLLYSGKSYTGNNAYKWDVNFVTYEQGTVAVPIYAGMQKETLNKFNAMANGKDSKSGWYKFLSNFNYIDFGKYKANVWDKQKRIDIPLNMLYGKKHKVN